MAGRSRTAVPYGHPTPNFRQLWVGIGVGGWVVGLVGLWGWVGLEGRNKECHGAREPCDVRAVFESLNRQNIEKMVAQLGSPYSIIRRTRGT